MNVNEEKLNINLLEALELLDKGKSIPEILNLFPEHQGELKEIFRIVDILKAERERLVPNRELLTKIISRFSQDGVVTKEKQARYYLHRGEESAGFAAAKGRPSIFEEVMNYIETMLAKWKILLPVGAVAAIVLIVAVTQFTGSTSAPFNLDEIAKEQETLDNLGYEIDQYSGEELALDEVYTSLNEAAAYDGAPTTQTPKAPTGATQDPFGLASIQTESNAVGFDSGLDSFFSEETSLNEIDSALSDF